jgi:hypothetical protein
MRIEIGQLRRWHTASGFVPSRVQGQCFIIIGEESYMAGMYRTPVLGHDGRRETWATKFILEFSEVFSETG